MNLFLHNKPSPAPQYKDEPMDDTERWSRFGVALGHIGGSIALTATGTGDANTIAALGQVENLALDAAFQKEKQAERISPGTDVHAIIAKPVPDIPAEPMPIYDKVAPRAEVIRTIQQNRNPGSDVAAAGEYGTMQTDEQTRQAMR